MAKKVFKNERFAVGISTDDIAYFNYSYDAKSITIYLRLGDGTLATEYLYGDPLCNQIFNFLMENWEHWSESDVDDSEPK